MTDESHTIPDDMATNYGRLINAAEDMRQVATDELKQVYSDLRDELKSLGWNGASVSFEVAALKGAISEMRLAEKDKTKREVRGERIDDYVSLLTRARARDTRPKSYSEAKGTYINPRLAKQVVDGMQTEAGRAALITAVDIMIDREEADQHTPSDAPHTSVSTVTPPADSEGEVSDGLLQNSPETANETPKQVYGDSVEDATAPPSQSVDIPAGGDQAQKIDGLDERHPAELNSPEQAPEDTAPHEVAESPSVERISPQADEATTGSAAANAGDCPDEVIERTANPETGQGLVNQSLATNGVRYEAVPLHPMRTSPFAHCFPELSKTAYQCLAGDIALNGVIEPIVRMGDIIIDGWNRYNAARSLGIEYPVIVLDVGADALMEVIHLQRSARDWTPAQEAKIAASLSKEFPDRTDDIWAAFHLALGDDGEVVSA